MSTLVGYVGDILAGALQWVQYFSYLVTGGTIGTGESAITVSAQPLIVLFLLIPLVGLGIGLFKRLINVN